jgi:hypothetical protein
MLKIRVNNLHLFWGVYMAFLFVLLPQEAWTIGQGQDPSGEVWSLLGVTASPLAWLLALAFSATIAIVTHRLNKHWMEMPNRYKAQDMVRKRFGYRWINVYALTLLITIPISAVANFMHVVEFTKPTLRIFEIYPWALGVYRFIFGMALPLVSMVFARVLSTMQESEQEEDPAFAKAKAELKEANSTIRSLEQSMRKSEQEYSARIRDAERLANESEQRYRAVGDVVRWLFGQDEALRDRIRGIRTTFPNLSQNGIAQLIGCSTSTVNDNLQGWEPEPQALPIWENVKNVEVG